MKTKIKLIKRFLTAITMLYLTVLLSCGDDNPQDSSMVKFDALASMVFEHDSNGAQIQISFSIPAIRSGTVKISTGNAIYGERFFTDPPPGNDGFITLNVLESEVGTSFAVLPVDDEFFKDNYVVEFIIVAVEGVVKGVFKEGPTSTHKLTILDDELPSIANYAVDYGEIDGDNDEGILIEISFSSPAAGTGEVHVTLPKYGNAYTVSEPVTNKILKLPVQFGDEGVQFTLVPLDPPGCENILDGLTLSGGTGVIKVGDVRTSYDLKIIPSDVIIAAFKKATGWVSESDEEGYVVEIVLSKPPSTDQSILVAFWGSAHRFETIPSMSVMHSGWYTFLGIVLPIEAGSEKVAFTVVPRNNPIKDGNFVAQFTLSQHCDSAKCSCIDSNFASFDLTILDDD
jgi:hypothetical protein